MDIKYWYFLSKGNLISNLFHPNYVNISHQKYANTFLVLILKPESSILTKTTSVIEYHAHLSRESILSVASWTLLHTIKNVKRCKITASPENKGTAAVESSHLDSSIAQAIINDASM